MPPPTAQQACIDGCPIVPSADLCILLRSRPADKGKKKGASPALSHRPSRHIAAPQRFSEETILSAHQTKPNPLETVCSPVVKQLAWMRG